MNDHTPESVTADLPAAWIGWDWADDHHDIFLETAEARPRESAWHIDRRSSTIGLRSWANVLRNARSCSAWRPCRSALLPILLQYKFLELYLVKSQEPGSLPRSGSAPVAAKMTSWTASWPVN